MDDSGGQVRNVALDNEQDGDWIPNEAYKLAHDFRIQHGNELTPALINQLLGDLNRIWREREKRQVVRVKQQA